MPTEFIQPIPRADAFKGKREQSKAENRQLILDAARQIFAELGYGAATVRDIIRATPLASGTFYNYFHSKEEVFQAIQDESALRVRPQLREVRAKAQSREEFISGTFRTFFEFAASDRLNSQALRRNGDALRLRMDSPEIIAGLVELREDLEAAIAKRLFPPVDADFLMAALVGVAFELAARVSRGESIVVDAAATFATALFVGGVPALPCADPECTQG